MTTGAWRRWADHPSPDDLPTRMRDDAKRHWETLTGWLRERYGLDGEIAWTDEDLGWVLRYRRNGRSLVTLLPTAEGGFSALVVLGPSLWDAVDELDLGVDTWEAYSLATAYVDGRWLWLRVRDARVVRDIRTLVALKSAPPLPPKVVRKVVVERRPVAAH
jgi:Protein of unknown function (DUF3788)